MTPQEAETDQHIVREFEAAERGFSEGAPPETYRVQVRRVIDMAKTLPAKRREHWFAELERIGETLIREKPEKVEDRKASEAAGKP